MRVSKTCTGPDVPGSSGGRLGLWLVVMMGSAVVTTMGSLGGGSVTRSVTSVVIAAVLRRLSACRFNSSAGWRSSWPGSASCELLG